MEALKLKRKALRTSFTASAKTLEQLINNDVRNSDREFELFSQLTDKYTRLSAIQESISELILGDANTAVDFEADFETAENYRETYVSLQSQVLTFKDKKTKTSSESNVGSEPAKLKLPKYELKKFSGNPKEFLTFWSMFSKIHESDELTDIDKFQYLYQSMIPESRAARLIESFLLTEANYPKAVSQLKARFGREDLLVQIYVRDLLSLVMKNAIAGRAATDLATLYDALETKLRALESLGRTKEKFADFLGPLVESCLPESVLKDWERSRNVEDDETKTSERSLEKLMKFLRLEIESEEMIKLAREGFGKNNVATKRQNNTNVVEPREVATASTLISTDEYKNKRNRNKLVCIFCEKNHSSSECAAAMKMTYSDKRNILFKKGACYACLNIGHVIQKCRVKLKCSRCSGKHCMVMCDNDISSLKKTSQCEDKPNLTNTLSNYAQKESVYLQTISVEISGQHFRERVRTLFDSASQRSYVSEKLMKRLKIRPIRHETVVHGLFGGVESKPSKHAVYSIMISDLKHTYKFSCEVFSEKKICGYVPRIEEQRIYDELKENNIEMTDSSDLSKEIDLLIGADLLGKLFTGPCVQLKHGLTAINTKLGWTVFGREVAEKIKEQADQGLQDKELTVLSLHVGDISLKNLWELDCLGISDPGEDISKKHKYEEHLKNFQEGLSILPNGRYEMKLPWSMNSSHLPDNRKLAQARHKRTMLKLKGEGKLQSYQQVFREWEELKMIEPVPPEESDFKCHFLPHRPVYKMTSNTTQIRPVFDASSREKGLPSLNQCLITGPNLLEEIPDILERFRCYPIGLSADIEKAYMQIQIKLEDRNYLRFYYPCEDLKEYRHTRVVFGITCSPFMLNASLDHLLKHAPQECFEVADKLENAFYVDNCLTGLSHKDEMEEFIEKTRKIMAQACFNLRGWESNESCPSVCKSSGCTNVLGLLWNLDRDTLKCRIDFRPLNCETKITKRFILATVQRVFDPIGLLAPATLSPKILLQETWKSKISWDEALPEEVMRKFIEWLQWLPLLENIEIPRYSANCSETEYHVFVDASQQAYGTVIFARRTTDGETKLTFLRAKSRVAPLKPLTIPRLELMACCLGVRLMNSISKALNLTDVKATYWSDSSVALTWIKEKGNWSVFISNRVKEIKLYTQPQSWKHVSGKFNPADVFSRGCSFHKTSSLQWWLAPKWLALHPENWPESDVSYDIKLVEEERKPSQVVNVNTNETEAPWYANKWIDIRRIIRLVAWILRFVNNCKKNDAECKAENLTSTEKEEAERALIRMIQNQHFSHSHSIGSLDVVKDEKGLLRVKTRISERPDLNSFLMPILLPGKSVFTKILVRYVHEGNCHAGTQILASKLRERFWIVHARKTIRQVIYECVKCKRHRVKPMRSEPGPLPRDRVSDTTVFQVIGVDLAGPLYTKNGDKVWIALFTCAVYRALHLELVPSLSTESFLLALRRFIARRGRPSTIYSDNGTNFRGSCNEFSQLDWDKISRETELPLISWKFNPPAAPWWGGWWERLVRIVKELLRRTLGKAILSFEELQTVICECESIINSRPLTYMSENANDLIPLTPAMFLYENRESRVIDLDTVDAKHLRKRVRYRAKLLADLRLRFRKEYLGMLIQRVSENKDERKIKPGDVVLIEQEGKKRVNWPLARVVELLPGRDQKIHIIKLKTEMGMLLRPIQRVYPLELQQEEPKVFLKGGNISSLPEERSTQKVSSNDAKKTRDDDDSSKKEAEDKIITSRSGRLVKAPTRLDLFNQNMYFIELHPPTL